MADAIGILAFLATLVLVLVALYHLLRRTGKAGQVLKYAGITFVIMIVAAVIAGPSDTADSPQEPQQAANSAATPQIDSTNGTDQEVPGDTEEQSATDQEGTEVSGDTEPDPAASEPEAEPTTDATTETPPEKSESAATPEGPLTVHFIDVGQADSILIQLPNDQTILIDAGNNADSDLVVDYLKQQGVSKLDHVIGTHPHEDHIGGLDVAIKSFDVDNVYLPRVSHTSQTFKDLLLAIQAKGLKITEAKAGVGLDVGQGLSAKFVAPNSSSYEDLNNYSAVLKLTYGQTSFLFTGDAEAESESEMLRAGYDLSADLLKVGHHGSDSSTTPSFLQAVSPGYAVISVGTDNDYGHPAPETIARLDDAGVKIFRTDEQGTIIATSDGQSITFNKEASKVVERAPPEEEAGAASNNVVISRISLSDEVATIENTGDSAVDLSGWKLVSVTGDQVFQFPSGYVLQPGATVRIHSGPDAVSNPPTDLEWTGRYIWNNDGDPGKLYNGQGELVSEYPR